MANPSARRVLPQAINRHKQCELTISVKAVYTFATLQANSHAHPKKAHMTESPTTFAQFSQAVQDNIARVVIGKRDVVEMLLVALLADGHVLLEDVPGIGKTTLAKALARSVDCTFSRIQFTPDLLPSDVTGINFFN